MLGVDAAQRRELDDLSRQTTIMWRRLEQLKRSNEEIQRLTAAAAADLARRKRAQSAARAQLLGGMGGGAAAEASMRDGLKAWMPARSDTFGGEAAQLALLNYDMTRALAETGQLRNRAWRVVRAKRAAELAQQRFLDSIPSIWPTSGFVSSGFGYRTDPDTEFHAGLDVVNDYGAPVYATAAGMVAEAGWDGGYGNKLVIDHGNGYETWYAHNSRLLVTAGQQVRKGQQIALVGATGFATGPHVHYEVLLWGKPIDPMQFLNGTPAQLASAR
jgi:murein DD-endopeptidase MepM/ murein hydrolase activator NlpD